MNKLLRVGLCVCLYAVWVKANNNREIQKYSNIWVAKIKGGEEVAHRIARDLGYTYMGKCGQFEDYYELVREDHLKMSVRDSTHLTDRLLDLDEVVWAGQQKLVQPRTYGLKSLVIDPQRELLLKFLHYLDRRRSKSSDPVCSGLLSCMFKVPTNILLILKSLHQGNVKKLGTFLTTPAPSSQLKHYSKHTTKSIGLLSRKLSAYAIRYTDPYWGKQWNMQDYRTVDMPVMDHNVVPAHNMGFTGKGVTVAVIDSGTEHHNPEYKDNFLKDLSFDLCKNKPGSHPIGNSHGTSCAGIIAMQPDNGICGVGIAFDANIVGIRAICDGIQVEYTTAKALMHNWDKIDIYSSSWGMYGKGQAVVLLDQMTLEAIETGITKGRGGKGVIYVKSAGNEKDLGDNCSVDQEVGNTATIGVAGADQWGKTTYYSERCPAIFATAYTENLFTEGIVVPATNGDCYAEFGGTSASAPQAAGIIALALEANPSLTYRDVMHLITMSSEVAPLANNKDTWYKNGRGFWVSNDFGFGLLNAENMVTLAKDWNNVPERRTCTDSVTLQPRVRFSYDASARIEFETTACQGSTDEVNYLEHIELSSFAYCLHRGDIMIYITSPSGTTTQLLEARPKDDNPDGLEGWSIMSTHNWGENPRGKWMVEFKITPKNHKVIFGYVREFSIRFHGTETEPEHFRDNKKREYAAFRLPNGKTSLD